MGYVNPSSMMALAVCFLNISSILVILRLCGRRMQKMRIWVDDIMLVISWILMLVMSIVMITAVAFRLWGKSLPPRRNAKGKIDLVKGMSPLLSESYEFFFFQELILPLQLMFAKLSILFFYRRVFCTTKMRDFMHWTTLVTIVLTAIWGIAMFFMYLFQCSNRPSTAWDSPLIDVANYCLPGNIELVMAGSDFSLDIIIMLLPIPRLIQLKITTSKKWLVVGAFLVGAMALVGSIVHLAIYAELLSGVKSSLTELDENMLLSTVMYWAMFEAGFAVATACLPSIQYMFIKAITAAGDAVVSSGLNTPFRSIRNFSIVTSWTAADRKGSFFGWNRKGSIWRSASDRKASQDSMDSVGSSHIDPKEVESGMMSMQYGVRPPIGEPSAVKTEVYAGYNGYNNHGYGGYANHNPYGGHGGY